MHVAISVASKNRPSVHITNDYFPIAIAIAMNHYENARELLQLNIMSYKYSILEVKMCVIL